MLTHSLVISFFLTQLFFFSLTSMASVDLVLGVLIPHLVDGCTQCVHNINLQIQQMGNVSLDL